MPISLTGVGDNRETQYSIEGANRVVATLDPANNIENFTEAAGVSPNADGEISISISLTPTENNTNGNHFTYLGVMQITAQTDSASFARQPADRTVIEHQKVTFDATITGRPPFEVQWVRNGDAIPGDTGFILHF